MYIIFNYIHQFHHLYMTTYDLLPPSALGRTWPKQLESIIYNNEPPTGFYVCLTRPNVFDHTCRRALPESLDHIAS